MSETKEFDILIGLTNEELEALAKLKEFSICKDIRDELLLVFLFSKKLNVEEVHEVIKNNLFVREQLGISFPVVKHQVNSELAKKASVFHIKGYTDRQGRAISYLHPSKVRPKDYTFKEYMTFLFWSQDQCVHEPPPIHRAGLTIIEDLDKVSIFKHFDSRLNDFLKKHNIKDMQNVFIGRIQKIYIINPPWLLKPLLSFARTFMKNKIISRVEICKRDYIFTDIDQSQVLFEYGGTLDITYADYFDSLPSNY